jgi:DNA replicative helicase MCM subunit Mcm2 (Cdc46/Mcm family)
MVVDALKFLLPEYQSELESDMPTELGQRPEEVEDEEEAEAAEEEKEDKVLTIITKLDKSGKGAAWDEIVEEVKRLGMDRTVLEEVTNSLLDKGLIYEPVLGRMKRI